MSWDKDKSAALLWTLGGLLSLLIFFANQMYADVQTLKEYRAANGATLDEINKRLERIENKQDQIISEIHK